MFQDVPKRIAMLLFLGRFRSKPLANNWTKNYSEMFHIIALKFTVPYQYVISSFVKSKVNVGSFT